MMNFELIIYTSLNKEIADPILDELSKEVKNSKLFSHRLYSIHCDKVPKTSLKLRNLNILEGNRRKENIIVLSCNLDAVCNHLKNVVPVKRFKGKR